MQEQFIGTWSLISNEFHRSDGTIVDPFGKDAVGRICYDAAGNMAAQLMRANRPNFVSNDQLNGTPDEIKQAFEGAVAYFGTYEIDRNRGAVIHRIAHSLYPNWCGQKQVRFFEFSADRLTLKTEPILAGGSTLVGVVVWQRVA